ncbi:MAG: hypothetical protein QGH45_13345, partial [Myxococcota bacterium]|nr:hypothetical protein [Myxococcota bacterium]
FLDGDSFDALFAEEGTSESEVELSIATDATELYVLVSNRASVRHPHFVDASVSLVVTPPDEGDDDDDGGCQCDQRGPRPAPGQVLLFLLLVGAGVRRRLSGR